MKKRVFWAGCAAVATAIAGIAFQIAADPLSGILYSDDCVIETARLDKQAVAFGDYRHGEVWALKFPPENVPPRIPITIETSSAQAGLVSVTVANGSLDERTRHLPDDEVFCSSLSNDVRAPNYNREPICDVPTTGPDGWTSCAVEYIGATTVPPPRCTRSISLVFDPAPRNAELIVTATGTGDSSEFTLDLNYNALGCFSAERRVPTWASTMIVILVALIIGVIALFAAAMLKPEDD